MGVSKGKALIDLWGIGVGNECVCAADGWKVEQAVAGAPMAAFTQLVTLFLFPPFLPSSNSLL